jgi:cell division inhibitor SepF
LGNAIIISDEVEEMSLIDKFLNVMRLNDDEDYAFDNEDYLDDDYEEEKETRKPAKPRPKEKREVSSDNTPKERTVKTTPKITPISKGTRKQGIAGMEVCVIKPTSVEDAREITETLLNGRTVVLNVEGLNIDIAQRIIDFTSGSCFAISGNFQKISNYIFIITPANVDISGDFLSLVDSLDTNNYNY